MAAGEGLGHVLEQGAMRGEDLQGLGLGGFDAGAQARAGGQFGRAKSNILVERFKANPEWQRLYEEKGAQLTSDLFASGKAAEILDSWVALLKEQASDLVDAATVDDEYDDDPPCCPAGSENKWDSRTWCGCQINR